MRLTYEQLEEVKRKYNVNKLYSWSKIETFKTSKYEYFLNYVRHEKPDCNDNAYSALGGVTHDILEKYYCNQMSYDDMLPMFEDGYLTNINILNMRFDKTNEEKNNIIGSKYKADIEHFLSTHNSIKEDISVEKFLAIKVGDYVLQGYADAITKDSDNNYTIIDWKTSTKFTDKKVPEKSGQLAIYTLGLHQLGVPINKIKACWNFLKYCDIEYQLKNGSIKTRTVERCKIGESLSANAKTWLNTLGYSNECDEYLKELLDTNSIDCLPDDVKNKYTIKDCYVYIPLSEEIINGFCNDIITTIKDIESREKDYSETHSDKCFWDDEESLKEQSYYYSVLCGYNISRIKPYAEYLDKMEKEKNGDNNFFGIGNNLDNIKTSSVSNMDLSWLADL